MSLAKKVETKIYLPPDVFEQVETATKQFRGAGRDVSRSEVITALLEEGLGAWRKERKAMPQIEATLGKLLDKADKLLDKADATDKVLRSILLTMADGDKAEVNRLMATIEGRE